MEALYIIAGFGFISMLIGFLLGFLLGYLMAGCRTAKHEAGQKEQKEGKG